MTVVKVYNGEKYDRSKWWYVFFGTVFALIVVLSLLFQNRSGVIVMFFFLGGYLFYQTIHMQLIPMEITKDYLRVGDTNYPWSSFRGFVLEVYKDTGRVKNIVFVTDHHYRIYSFGDELSVVKDAVVAISNYIPMLESYRQSFSEKFSRKIQL